ncbi:hypothetical protein SBRCBS47491_002517 [Sporothrix bragantina]|uniref:Uncharacterized protein n=1 Tax=Sporothrix bragantina TaxID=671064 RepID=A0ABP0B7K0_9PEZI
MLLERFLDNHPAATITAVPSNFPHNVAVPTQRQPKANPPPAGVKISHARDKRSDNRIGQYDWYDEFPVRPNWTARDGNHQAYIKYSKQGELKPVVRFDVKTLEAYIRGCAQQGIPLRIWVQNSATMHTDRFPSRASSICRAANCPVRSNTIARGMYQVCFDEYPEETTNGRYDPFFVAGYMHLFCLEEAMSIAELMTFADVQPDVREFPLEQRNPMSLNRDGVGRTLQGAYNEWKSMHYDRYVYNNIPIPKGPRKSADCLYKHLTIKKMEMQPTTRQKMRDQRNGFDISKHCGNLRKLMSHKADAKKKRRLQADSSEDDSENADSDVEVVVAPSRSPPKRQRYDLQPVPATSLRRSRRLSSATAAAHQIDISAPAALPGPAPAPDPAAPEPIPMQATYTPYDIQDFSNYNFAFPTAAPASRPRTTSRGLNVITDQSTMMASNHDIFANFDFSNINMESAVDAFNDAYSQIMMESRATETQTGLPPLPVYGASPQSPYTLRDTQARRESAVRLLSARTSRLSGSSVLIDPQLLRSSQSYGSARPATPRARPSSSLANVSTLQDEPDTPSRRVTRSMSRTGTTPVETNAGLSKATTDPTPESATPPIVEETAAITTEASEVANFEVNLEVSPESNTESAAEARESEELYRELFGDIDTYNIDFGEYLENLDAF